MWCTVCLLLASVSIEVPSSCFVCVLKALKCLFFIHNRTFFAQYCSSFLLSLHIFCILESDDVTAKSSMLIGNEVTQLCAQQVSHDLTQLVTHAVTCAREGIPQLNSTTFLEAPSKFCGHYFLPNMDGREFSQVDLVLK